MLLFTLLINGILKAERGDVVVFNNTSSEHPRTYDFVRDCQAATEARGIPFFLVEFQTYEDARRASGRDCQAIDSSTLSLGPRTTRTGSTGGGKSSRKSCRGRDLCPTSFAGSARRT